MSWRSMGVLESKADIVVIERCHVRAHGQGVVQCARGLDKINSRMLRQKVRRLGVDTVDDIDLTRHDGVLARGRIGESSSFQRRRNQA